MVAPDSTRRVFLVGFMGAGKTSVGQALAQRLGWVFYDLDQLIEQRQQRSVAEIFSSAGETAFRQMESAVLLELLGESLNHRGQVVALGGGAFIHPANREALQRSGALTVLLEAPVEELERRCQEGGASRPLAGDRENFRRLFASRYEAYALADLRVQTGGKAIAEVAEEIGDLMGRARRSEAAKSWEVEK